MSQIVENTVFRNVEESFEKFLDSNPEADDFKNLTSSFLSTDTSLVKFSWVSDQQHLRKVANRQTDRQKHNKTNKRPVKHK